MKSVLIIGMGRTGRHLALKLEELGNDVMVIDVDRAKIEAVSDRLSNAQIGDCTNEVVLKALGVKNFDLCFVTIGENFEASLVITSLLKKMGASHVIAKSKLDIQAELLLKIGADEIIYPEKDVAESLAVRYSADNIFDYVELTGEYSIYEIPVVREWVGHSLIELDIRKKHGINVIAVKNRTLLDPVPAADYRFRADDHIMVIGKSKDVFKITAKLK
ncbi:MAG: TrkA family potassium uptake protein [Clostridia bacterium]|nr:TrkA family potassium uptake protein [Clostridia bacterium]